MAVSFSSQKRGTHRQSKRLSVGGVQRVLLWSFLGMAISGKLLKQRILAVSLHKLLLCFFIFIALIPLLFLGTWVERNTQRVAINAVQEKHLLLAENLSGSLSRYAMDLEAVFIAKSEAEPIKFSPEIKTLLQSVNIQMLALISQPSNHKNSDSQRKVIGYCMGNYSFFPATGMAALAVERQQAFLHPQQVIMSPVILDTQGNPTIYLLRVTTQNVLAVAAVSTDYFQQVQESVRFGELGHAAIVDHTGKTIAHPKAQWRKTAKDLSQIEPVKRMLTGESGVVEFYSPALQMDMVAGYSSVPGTGWGVMIPQPQSELQTLARPTKLVALSIAGLGLLLSLWVSWRLTVYLLDPIRSVIGASRALARGNKIDVLAIQPQMFPQEIYELLQAFDQMAMEVSSARTTLEQRVEERTQELVKEVEQRKALELQLIQKATHDILTGLPNRRLLAERLESTIEYAIRDQRAIALLFLDLDGFKAVNDTYGHAAGDELLVQVAERLRTNLRKNDSVFRLGGDEFVILAEQIDRPETARALATDLLEAIQDPYRLDNYKVRIGGSIGIKIRRRNGHETAYEMLAAADNAMYQAKETGNCAIVY
ncbi:MAG: diguanylate cyclase [Cyanobacteria bacterium P01_F01_bin.53]